MNNPLILPTLPTVDDALMARGKGLVVVFHCVPAEVEPRIERFWLNLRRLLQGQGQELLLVSTAQVSEPQLPFISIPFHLPDILGNFEGIERADPRLVSTLANWYRIGKADAANVLNRVGLLIDRLLESTQPAAVISWQSAHPLSRLVRQNCQSLDIPWWCAERGWLRDTLMIDLCENNGLSEVSRSIGLRRAYERYQPLATLPQTLLDRMPPSSTASRYPQNRLNERPSLRQRLGLPQDACIFAWLTHGEPHVNSIANPSIQANHGMDQKLLQTELVELANELKALGSWLVVREHPFNAIHNRCLDIQGLTNVFLDDGDLDDLLEQADFFLFTLSTLQFELVLRKKPFGLLARSLLSGPGEAPFRGDFGSCGDFLKALMDAKAWIPRHQALLHKVCFLYDHQLLDIAPERGRQAAQDLAGLLAGYNGLLLAEALAGLKEFLSHSPPQVNTNCATSLPCLLPQKV